MEIANKYLQSQKLITEDILLSNRKVVRRLLSTKFGSFMIVGYFAKIIFLIPIKSPAVSW
ncbi:hypothetical protein BAC3_01067 [uncultured bacterium]|nr:hypothetical protein BAC3_01067 [uncultured bacterium]